MVWINAQRRLKIGVNLDEGHSDEVWNKKHQELKEYVNNHYRLPQKNDSLFTWVMDQKTREKNKILLSNRKCMLERLGVTFENRKENLFGII